MSTVGWFDCSRLERAVVNLLLNAWEPVDPGSGQIVIATTGRKDAVEIDISDDGPGIPAMIQDSVLNPL